MTVTQGGTRTRGLANGLPCLTNWSTESLGNSVAEFEYLRLSCQGSSRSGYQAGMFNGGGGGGGAASMKCKVQAQFFNMLTVRP